jgi:hypothetical protein
MAKTPAQLVMDDYGEIGHGASKAHTIAAENGEEFIIKGPSFTPEHPTVVANEWSAAQLAEALSGDTGALHPAAMGSTRLDYTPTMEPHRSRCCSGCC